MTAQEIRGRSSTQESVPVFLQEIAAALVEINERMARQEGLAQKLGELTLANAERIAKELQ